MRLSTQFAILMSVLIVVLFAGGALFQMNALHKHLDQQQQNWSQSLAVSIVEGLAYDVINGNVINVREKIGHIVSSNNEIDYAYIVDFDNKIFAHTFVDGFPLKFYEQLDEHMDNIKLRFPSLDGRQFIESSFPIIEGMTSHLHIGIDRAHNEMLFQEMLIELAALFMLAVVGGIVLSLALGRYLLRPLGELTSQLRSFGEGVNVSLTTTPYMSQEVRDLENSFQRMIVERERAEAKSRADQEQASGCIDIAYA